MADMVEKLHQAAAAGDVDGVRSALAAGANVNSRREFGDAALNLAAENGHESVVLTLVGAGANIENVAMDAQDGSQYTAMHFTLEVKNRQHLAAILRSLRRVQEVMRIARVKG